MGIKVAGNVPYKGRRAIRMTMPDGRQYFIGRKTAEDLGMILLAASIPVRRDPKNLEAEMEGAVDEYVNRLERVRKIASSVKVEGAVGTGRKKQCTSG